MEGDEVGLGVDVLERCGRLDPELAEALWRDIRVVCENPQPERGSTAGDLPADAAEAQHAEGLAGELDPGEPLPLPAPRSERSMRLGNVARDRQEERDRVLRGRDDGRLGRVRDDDAPPRGGVDVDVVEPHARAPDHFESPRLRDHVRVESRPRADDDGVELSDDRAELALRVLDDVEPLAEEGEPGLGDRLADENPLATFRHGEPRGTPRPRSQPPRHARCPRRARQG